MRLFDLHNLSASVYQLTAYAWLADRHDKEEEIEIDVAAEMLDLVERLAAQTKYLQLKASRRRATRELRFAFKAYGKPTWGRVEREFKVFWEILESELMGRRVVSLEAKKDEYLSGLLGDSSSVSASDREEADPVWQHLWKRFPSAKTDGEEAVYCYVLERNTACVFHAVRVAEIGLRALARRMKVKLPKRKRLEWAQWQEVLREMRAKTEHLHASMKAGPAKDEALEFFNGAIGQFYGFKDEFRNQVMHTRKHYDEFEAASALTRVRDFMDKLSHKIDEKGRVFKT